MNTRFRLPPDDQERAWLLLRDALNFRLPRTDGIEYGIWDILQELVHPDLPRRIIGQLHMRAHLRREVGLSYFHLETLAAVMERRLLRGGGDGAHAVDMYEEILAAWRSTAGHIEGGGSAAHVLDEGGGRADSIAMGRRRLHSSVGAARKTNKIDIDSFFQTSRYSMFGAMVEPVSDLIESNGRAMARELLIARRDDMLQAQRSTNGYREGGGSEAHVLDEGGGRAYSSAMGGMHVNGSAESRYQMLGDMTAHMSGLIESTGHVVARELLIGHRVTEMVAGDMLQAQHSSNRYREAFGSEAHVLYEGVRRAHSIAMGGMHVHGSAASRYQMRRRMMVPLSDLTEPIGHAVARAEMVAGDMLQAQRSSNGYREAFGSEAHVLDEGGGRAYSSAMGGMHVNGSAASRYQMVGGMMVPVSHLTEPTGHAVARAEMVTDDMLHAQHSTNGYREGSGSEAHVLDEGGGRADSEIVQNYERLYQVPVAVSNLEATGNAVPTELLIGRRAVEMVTGNMLPAQRYTARAGERGGSQAYVVDEGGGRAVYIAIDVHGPQQNDQASVEAAPTTNLTVVEQVLSAVSAGLVLLSVTNLYGTFMGGYPEFIKLGLFATCALLTVLTFLGIMIKKMGKVAMRVVACMSITAMTITAVYQVSEEVYIKCIIAVMGAIATMVMGLTNWR